MRGCLAWTKRCLSAYRRGAAIPKSTSWRANASGAQKLWIDCDCGVDDAQGIMIVLASDQFDVIGISSVRGNVGATQAAKNISTVLQYCGREDIPVYAGLDAPITRPFPKMEPDWFGKDGLGDAELSHRSEQPPMENASRHLVDASLKHHDLSVLAIGPVTNIADACQLDSAFPGRVKSFICMGGAYGEGNMPGATEFNFFADPDAASIVLKSFPLTKLITWDLAKKCGWDAEAYVKDKSSCKGKFMQAIMKNPMIRQKSRADGSKVHLWTGADPVASAVLVSPSLVTKFRFAQCDIDCTYTETAGRSVFHFDTDAASSNVEVPDEVNMPGFLLLLNGSLE
ncbi:hypothetical protein BSKO_13909 [Bryopsis sp. KO-2023]|nr:hypothetical protein BSKO_13909 [Bryopsis sp. KO-2023]